MQIVVFLLEIRFIIFLLYRSVYMQKAYLTKHSGLIGAQNPECLKTKYRSFGMNAQSEVRQGISGGRSLVNLCGGINLANAPVAGNNSEKKPRALARGVFIF
ncbi:MAG: hypothetical protein WBE75_04610 [Candidatus Omnitrophota bacterium]